MGFAGYFLIVADFIKWAKANDIPVGPGRGSGAGSVVAWSRSTATGPHEAQHAARAQAFDPNAMHRTVAAPLAEQKVHDMSLVYSDER